jgi:hypothetical protein
MSGLPKSLPAIVDDPQFFFPFLIMFALGLSLVTTLAGVLCYDYSLRFDWHSDDIRNLFIGKGHNLGRWGFYSLMWSIAAVGILRNYYLCMIAVLVVFWVMWYYYFFPQAGTSDKIVKARKTADETIAKELAEVRRAAEVEGEQREKHAAGEQTVPPGTARHAPGDGQPKVPLTPPGTGPQA